MHRGEAAGMSDHCLIEGRIRMNGSFWGEWKSTRNLRVVKNHMSEKEVREAEKENAGVDHKYEIF